MVILTIKQNILTSNRLRFWMFPVCAGTNQLCVNSCWYWLFRLFAKWMIVDTPPNKGGFAIAHVFSAWWGVTPCLAWAVISLWPVQKLDGTFCLALKFNAKKPWISPSFPEGPLRETIWRLKSFPRFGSSGLLVRLRGSKNAYGFTELSKLTK